MIKLLFDSLRGVKLKKTAKSCTSQKFVFEECGVFQNRLLKFLPANFRYYRSSGEKNKMAATKLPGSPKLDFCGKSLFFVENYKLDFVFGQKNIF